MRRIVMFNRISADGYFASTEGTMDWIVPDDAIDRAGAARMPEVDAMLFGRHTYDAFESFWPRALDADPHIDGRSSPAIKKMASWINATPKFVFSNARKSVSWQNSQLLGAFDPAKVRALKEQPGKNIMVFGSGSIVSLLTEHGLIDEYHFVVTPLFLGSRRSLIGDLPQRVPLELLEATRHDSGNVVLRYGRKTG